MLIDHESLRSPHSDNAYIMTIPSRSLLCAFSFCLIQTASAEVATNWPLPTPPLGANPALFAVPRNDWWLSSPKTLIWRKKQKST